MVKGDLSSLAMQTGPGDLAQVRLDNALALFEEFVRQTARHADAATLRGLERRFAERVQIQPSYWSQIKGRSRQIGERLARQFEQLCHKPAGWLDQRHATVGAGTAIAQRGTSPQPELRSSPPEPAGSDSAPQDDDERFIVGLVLTYYRRHPQRARQRLLDLLGEVLTPPGAPAAPPKAVAGAPARGAAGRPPGTPLSAAAEDAHDLWLRSQSGVAPLKRKK
jgi:hypothetical protein